MYKDIAIIGIAGRFPNSADIKEFTHLLKEGRDGVRELSRKRKSDTNLSFDKEYQVLGFLEDIDKFDYDFFGILPGEANYMDPHQRILLEVVYHAIENAGYNVDDFNGSNTSIFIGDTSQEYHRLAESFDPLLITGNLSAITAGRIARYFNLIGNAQMVDTACSSSLVALHNACNELMLGQADCALVAGINLVLFPAEKSVDEIGIMSNDGRARSFSADANGTGGGEIAGCVLLKPLEAALRDNDTIQAVIKGIAVNQDAQRSSSLTAPSSNAQSEVIIKAWKQANIDPSTISLIEAHGTGTKLGDPIEVEGITKAFREYTEKHQFCALSTIKSTIGHTNTAAGIAGLIKTVLSLKNKELYASLHFSEPNPLIDFVDSPVYVNTKHNTWDTENNQIRRAGVSSFGLSGTNCHLVLEESPEHFSGNLATLTNEPLTYTLSSKTKEGLLLNAKALQTFLVEKSSEDIFAKDVSFTLNVGRKHYKHRLAFVASSLNEFSEKLKHYIASFSQPETVDVTSIWISFSENSEVPDSVIKKFRDKFSAFKSALEECAIAEKNIQLQDEHRNTFCFHYAYYKLLESFGVASKNVIGSGIGKLVIEVLKEKKSLEEAFLLLADYKKINNSNLEERLAVFVKEKLSDESSILIEAGVDGEIPKLLLKQNEGLKGRLFYMQKETAEMAFSELLVSLYQKGVSVLWKSFYNNNERRIELPAYHFSKTRCWLDPMPASVSDWVYKPVWTQAESSHGSSVLSGHRFVLFMNSEDGAGQDVFLRLTQGGNECIRVIHGDVFMQVNETTFTMPFEDENAYKQLQSVFVAANIQITGIIHLGAYCFPSANTLEDSLKTGLYSQFMMVKAFDYLWKHEGVYLYLITSNARRVTQKETNHIPLNSTVNGFANGLVNEYPKLTVKCIDVDMYSEVPEDVFACIEKEFFNKRDKAVVAYRNNKRFLLSIERHIVSKENNEFIRADKLIRNNGVYVIAGGASGIGLEVAKYISTKAKVKLAIISRKSFDDLSVSDTALEAFKEIEKSGTRIQYFSADISDTQKITNVFEEIHNTLGKINGVIHSAGLPGGVMRTKNHSLDSFKETLLPKIYGSVNLVELVKNDPLDFFVMFSSLNSILGGDRGSNYSAASIFQDNYISEVKKLIPRALVINWPAWRETGQWKRFNDFIDTPVDYDQSILSAEGIAVFEMALTNGWSNTIVSNTNPALLGENPFFIANTGDIHLTGRKNKPVLAEKRAEEKSNYTFNSEWSETENKVAEIWYLVLKINSLNLDDNYFKLGGHSLLGIRIINRIEKELEVEMEFRNLLQYPTVKELSHYIDNLRQEGNIVNYEKIEPVPHENDYELSHAQKRLWVLDKLTPGTSSYNVGSAYIIEGKLDKEAFSKAFVTLVQSHESLRTVFMNIDGEPRQKIIDPETSIFTVEYISLADSQEPESLLREYIESDMALPFDLEKGPLLRATLISLPGERYAFIFNIHHIICDGWSMAILIEQIISLYTAFVSGSYSLAAPLKIQYKDYAAWQNKQIQNNSLSSHASYWQKQFSDIPSVLDLPTDRSRPARLTYGGSVESFKVDKDLLYNLEELSRKEGSTLFMLLVAAVNVLLHRYTSKEDLIVGTPIAGRYHSDLEQQIGFYVNSLPLRTRLKPDMSFRALLREVKDTMLDSYKHQVYPFDKLIDDLKIERNLNRSPLFDVMVVLHNNEKDKSTDGIQSLKLQSIPVKQVISKFDLSFNFREGNDKLETTIEYSTDLFDEWRIKQMCVHLHMILKHISEEPAVTLKNIQLLSEKENHYLLNEFNDTSCIYPSDKTIIDFFEAQVKHTPDKVAIIFGNNSWSYAELNRKASQIAALIISRDVKKGEVVGIMVKRSLEMMAGILGILKAGAAYLPIDSNDPEERIANMFSDCGVSLLLTNKETDLSFEGVDVLNISTVEDRIPMHSTVVVSPADPVYVIYTSGSTGRPKGVKVSHTAVVNRLNWMQKSYPLASDDVVLQKTPYTFDVSVWEIFWWTMGGSSLVLLDPGEEKNPQTIINTINKYQITVLHFVPSMFSSFLEAIRPEDKAMLKSLKQVFCSGEALMLSHVESFNSLIQPFSGAKLSNLYGPTEATVDVSYFDCANLKGHTSVPIGKPIDNIKLYVVDGNDNLVPIGVPGELLIAGVGLAMGYQEREELTKEKFNKFAITGERVYRTGDMVALLKDGNIAYYGRNDNQIKIRGYRIELGEIETALMTVSGIKQVAALIKKDTANDNYICAYYKGESSLTNEVLREKLKKKLPDYMIPSVFKRLDMFPLTSSGKTDRKALELYADESMIALSAHVLPQGEVEKMIADIWSRILGKEIIGRNDNFFEIGGHSLKATKFIAFLYKEQNVQMDLALIFEKPTIAELSLAFDKIDKVQYNEIIPIEEQPYYEVSHAQKRLWFVEQKGQDHTAYNIPSANLLEGEINIPAFKNALEMLIRKHESMRTIFITVNGEPKQKILSFEDSGFKLDVGDYRTEANPEIYVKAIVERDSKTAFDLSVGPLIRAGIYLISEKQYVFYLNIHHIISDEWSMGIFINELLGFYKASIEGKGQEFIPLKVQYKDYSAWQNKQLSGDKIKEHQNYWLGQFKESIPLLNLPSDFIRPKVKTHKGNTVGTVISEELTMGLKALSLEHGASLYMTLLTLINTLMHRYSNQEDIVIGFPIAGREHPDLEDQLGFYVNTLALRTKLSRTDRFDELLKKIKDNTLNAYKHQVYPFNRLLEDLRLERDDSRHPLFDVNVVFQNTDVLDTNAFEDNNAPGKITVLGNFLSSYNSSKYDLIFHFRENANCLHLGIEYSTDLFKEERISRIFGHLETLIGTVIKDTSVTIGNVELLTPQEKQTLLFDYNNDKQPYAEDKTVLHMFMEQVVKHPENIALVFNDEQLTYRELDVLVSRYSGFIKEQNLSDDAVVVIMLDRSIYVMAAILGVLKAGYAYLPLEPENPFERLKYILNDSCAEIIISQKKYLKKINKLQWECEKFKTYLCVDTENVCTEAEEANSMMNIELWDYVGENTHDDISGGGWTSSYTGLELSREEMDEYASNVVQKIRPHITENSTILEIGCASGITMFSLAPFAKEYVGTDLSSKILAKTQLRADEGGFKNVRLEHLAAHEIDQLDESKFDIIIINSVIQSFHGYNYLRDVIRKSVNLLKNKGIIFLGDIQDQDLKEDLISSLTDFKRKNKIAEYRTKTDWSKELFISRRFLRDMQHEFPEIKEIKDTLKIGEISNELKDFRFDVILEVNKSKKSKQILKPRYKYQYDGNALVDNDKGKEINTISSGAAYIIYTSGSTGQPKGVVVGNKSLQNYISWANGYYFSEENAGNMALLTSLAFDLTVTSMFCPITLGNKLFIYEGRDIDRILTVCFSNMDIQTLKLTPTHISLLNHLPIVYSPLKQVIVGGEILQKHQIDTLYAINPDVIIYNEYGPTEATVGCTVAKVTDSYYDIGQPIANTQLVIIDEYDQLLPVGMDGELCVSGNCLALEYHNKPELTKSKFLVHPFVEGERLYRTGDLARWQDDGTLLLKGRIDDQIKINGYRIELGEIAKKMLLHSAINDAVIIIHEKENDNKKLVAYIVADRIIEHSELHQFLLETLPPYMIPSEFVTLEKFPLTSNGKLDITALPGMESVNKNNRPFKEPVTEIEQLMASIWKAVLDRGRIGIDEDFFEIGGDSIKAIQVAARMHKEGYNLQVKDIFKNSTIESLALIVTQLLHVADQSAATGNVLLTPMQIEFFKWDIATPAHFNQAVMLYTAGGFNEEMITAVFIVIQNHHDALRMTFKNNNGKIEQFNNEIDMEPVLVVENIDGDIASEIELHANKLQRSIDLERGPLMKLGLFKAKDGDRLLIVIHHLVIDGMSWRILFEDITLLNKQYNEGVKLELPLKTDSFKRWSSKLNEYANTEEFLEEKTFWQEQEQIVVSELCTDYEGANEEKDTNTASFELSKEQTEQLINANSAYNTEINDLLLSGLGQALKKSFGMERSMIALESHGREELFNNVDINRTIGWFTSVFPVVIDMNYSADTSRYIKEVKESLHKIPNKGVGYWILKHLTNQEYKSGLKLNQNPEISFNYLGQFDSDLKQMAFDIAQESPGQSQGDDGKRQYLLDVSGMITGGQLRMSVKFSMKQYKKESIESLAYEYKEELKKIIEHCISKDEKELTPSDLSFKGLNVKDLETFFDE